MRRIEWRQTRMARDCRDIVVWVDAKAAEASWSRDGHYYLPPGGGYRRDEYRRFGEKLDNGKTRVPFVEAGILDGKLIITAGDYAFRWLIDHGAAAIPLSMEWPCGIRASAMIATDLRICEISL